MSLTAPRTKAYAWTVVALLWPVAMLNYLDRQMVATVRASIRADISSIASDQAFGTLVAVFMWVYALLSPIGGFIGDKFNRRLTVIGSLFVWSAVTYLTGQARSYQQMLWLRALMGISEAFYMPAALALITEFHVGGTRARAVGIHLSGIYTGLALGGLGGYIAQTSSWRNCFTWFGEAGVCYAVVLALALRDPVPPSDDPSLKKPSVTIGDTLRALWMQPAFCLLVVYFTLPAIAIQLGALAGVLAGGAVADAWMRATPRGRIYTSAIGTLLLVPALLGLGYAWNLPAAIGSMMLFGIGWGFFDCNNMPILCQIARPEHRATGYGFMNLVSISVGAFTTVALGWMRDEGISFSIAFAFSAAVALLSAGLILLVKPR